MTAHRADYLFSLPRSTWHFGIVLSASAGRAVLDWTLLCLERSAQRRALDNLDDRLLRDVGLTRKDAAAEAERPFWRD